MKIVAILMASGMSKRYGQNKAFLPFLDGNLLENAINNLLLSKLSHIVIVANEENFNFLKYKTLDKKITLINNPNYQLGQSQSIKSALSLNLEYDAYMFCSLDQPFLKPKSIDKLIDNFWPGDIIIPKYGDKNGLPSIFDRCFKYELLALSGDNGGKEVMKNHKKAVKFVSIKNALEGFDVDTKEDFLKLKGFM